MNLIQNIIPIYLLLEISIAMRNFHYPHYYQRRSMQHDYQHYDSYSSDGRVMRSHRKRHHHRRPTSDYSDSHNWESLKKERECHCSCAQCMKAKHKSCCIDFCSTQCGTFNNLIVVPYPVPFVVLNQSEPSTTTTTTTETTPLTSTSTNFPQSRKTLGETISTPLSYFHQSKIKRFRILPDTKNRRIMDDDMMHTPKFDKLPKYGIVPIPEKLAMSLMSRIRGGKKSQFQERRNLGRNVMDYGEMPFA